jgi:putative ABC transport system permease protein
MGIVWQDLTHALRALLKQPGYLATALLTLAIGVGFTTATFSVIDAVLLRPLPYDDPSRLVHFTERAKHFPNFDVSPGHYLFWRDHATSFEGIGAWQQQGVNFQIGSQDPQRLRADRVTANLFSVLGAKPILGRTFEAADDLGGAPRVVLLSYGAWQRRFSGQASVIGQVVRIDRESATIVGVMGKGFVFPDVETEMWVPTAFTDAERRSYGSHYMSAIGRLKPGVTLEQADADMKVVSARLRDENPGSAGWSVVLSDLLEYTVGDVRRSLLVLFGAVSLVLLIACVNVANLLLVRGAARHRELAIRSAIGATRSRLLRQLLVEQVALAVVSAVAGVLVAAWLLRALLALVPDAVPRQVEIGVDGPVLAFALALAALTPIVFGLYPALHASRPDVRSLLAAGGRLGGAAPAQRVRTVLVTLEMALAVTLVIGAGLLVRSFSNLLHVSPGFVPERAVVTSVSLPVDKYPEGDVRESFLHDFLSRVRTVPGVTAVGLAMPMPMVDHFGSGLDVEGRPVPSDRRPIVDFFSVSADYFAAIGTPLLKGRFLTDADRADTPRVAVVNQTLVDRFFPGENPLGRRIKVTQGDSAWREIVGVVSDVKARTLQERGSPQVYESYLQHGYFNAFSVVARTTSDTPTSVVPSIRSILRSMDDELPLGPVQTLGEIVATTVRSQRFSTTLIGLFGAAALLLAAVGVYSVMAYTVGLRRQEFAIRVAHGASRSDILGLVLRGAAGMSLAGIAVGAVAAWALRRAMENLLFGVTPEDRLTYVAGTALLALVSLAASAVPALRAARTDPLVALRGD